MTCVQEQQALEHLKLGRQLFKNEDFEGAIGACQNALYVNKNLNDAMLLLADALVQLGYVDAAILYLQGVLAVEPQNNDAKLVLDRANSILSGRICQIISIKRIDRYSVIKYLGSGWEGAVYLTQDSLGDKFVVKLFHPHIAKEINGQGPVRTLRNPVARCRPILWSLSNCVKRTAKKNCDTLYAIDFLNDGDAINGIVYRYEYLIGIQRRYLKYFDVPIGVVGAFLRTQAYLLQNMQCCLVDALPRQFMITRTGEFRLIDYGIAIVPIDDFRCMEEHWEIVSFIRLLDKLFNPKKKHLFFDTNINVLASNLNGLYETAQQHDWLNVTLATLDKRRYRDFLDYNFYLDLASKLPKKLKLTTVSQILVFDSLSRAKNLLISSISPPGSLQ